MHLVKKNPRTKRLVMKTAFLAQLGLFLFTLPKNNCFTWEVAGQAHCSIPLRDCTPVPPFWPRKQLCAAGDQVWFCRLGAPN